MTRNRYQRFGYVAIKYGAVRRSAHDVLGQHPINSVGAQTVLVAYVACRCRNNAQRPTGQQEVVV